MNKAAFSFGVLFSVFVALSPFAVWQAFLGDPLYDSLFGPSFGSLPVLKAGRVMPVSSASADVLKSISGSATARVGGGRISSSKWLWTLSADAARLAGEKTMRTDNRDLQKILGVSGRYFSYDDLAKNYAKVEEAASSDGNRPLASAAAEALEKGLAYAVAANAFSVKAPGEKSAVSGIENWRKAVEEAAAELKAARAEKREPDSAKLSRASVVLEYLRGVAEFEGAYPDAAVNSIAAGSGYSTPSKTMLDLKASELSKRLLNVYARAGDAIAAGDIDSAKNALSEADEIFSKAGGLQRLRLKVENFANALSPFFGGFILYFFALAAFGLSQIFSSREAALRTFGTVFMAFAAFLQVLGIALRMYIQMRPPVTNLYSSLVFAGAVAAVLGAYIYFRKNYVSAAVAACASGLMSLMVAMNLPYSGDTMGMMRAVLNSNFWLTAHVVTIMVGYCGVFLAGFMAQARLVANVFSRGNFGAMTGDSARTVFAVLCFALMFTFAGTMLGGIWADMSWGRFWGWDPKENGALMTVLWTAAAIHAKSMRLCSDRAFLGFAVFGNIVAAWAWFGVNLMGVGLHAYGFIEGGWFWFFAFVCSQLLTLPLCLYKFSPPPAQTGVSGENKIIGK